MRQRLLVIDHRAEIMAGMVPEFVGGLFYGASVKANSARLRGLQFGLPVCQAHPTHRDCVAHTTKSAGEILRDLNHPIEAGSEWRMEVVDEGRKPLFSLRISRASRVRPPRCDSCLF